MCGDGFGTWAEVKWNVKYVPENRRRERSREDGTRGGGGVG